MKFTSVAVLALFLANTSAVKLEDDCGGKWCNKGLSYDLDEATLRKAEADNVKKTHALNGATKSYETAKSEHAAAAAKASDTADADAAAGAAKVQARKDLLDTAHIDPSYDSKEKKHEQSVYTKWATYDAKLKAADDEIAK